MLKNSDIRTLSLKAIYVSTLTIESDIFGDETKLEKVVVFTDSENYESGETVASLSITRNTAYKSDFTTAAPFIRVSGSENNSDHAYGYIQNGTDELVLFVNYGNTDVMLNNVEITYPSYDKSINTADYINKCTFGIVFTDQYGQNRLVISGNSDYKNYDWWNESINIYSHEDDARKSANLKDNDFTYFPDKNYCVYGEDNGAIVGYDVDENGKLIVFKERQNNEPTIYFREGVQVYSGNTSLNTSTYEYKLNMFAGNTGVYPLNPRLITNFAGKTLFLSNEKVIDLLVSTDALKDKGKYATNSSYYIDGDLKNYTLDELKNRGVLASGDRFLYLGIGSTIYVARYDEFDSSTYQYEWYVWKLFLAEEDEYITSIYTNEEQLIVGTSTGNLYSYNTKGYIDEHRVFLEDEDFTENVLAPSIIEKVEVGDYLNAYGTYVYIRLNNTKLDGSGVVSINELGMSTSDEQLAKLLTYSISTSLNFNLIPSDKLMSESSNPRGLIKNVRFSYDSENNTFVFNAIPDVDLSEYYLGFRYMALYLKASNKEVLPFTEVNKKTGEYKLVFNFDGIILSELSIFFLGGKGEYYVYRKNVVPSVYVCSPFYAGTLSYYKHIYSYTLINDSRKESELYCAIMPNRVLNAEKLDIGIDGRFAVPISEYNKVGESFSLNLDELDFTGMSLSQDYIPAKTYTKYRNIVRQKYTNFVFYNKNATNSVLSAMSIIYTINNAIKGGDE